jgi:hypothetical protein
MDVEDDDKPVKPPMKRKKLSVLISSDEEDEIKAPPPKKKPAAASPKKDAGPSKPNAQTTTKAAPARKPVPNKSKGMNFIVPSDSESEVKNTPSKGKGQATTKGAVTTKTTKKQVPSKKDEDKTADSAKADNDEQPKSKFKCVSLADLGIL